MTPRKFLACVAVAGLVCGGVLLVVGRWRRDATTVREVRLVGGGHAVPGPDAGPTLVAARARYLIGIAAFDAAEAEIGRLAPGEGKAGLLLTLGNARLRQALAVFNGLPFRKVKPMIVAARYDYRLAASLEPGFWDARYNFALATELLPAREIYKRSSGAQMSHDKAVWPDLPGVPNGMP